MGDDGIQVRYPHILRSVLSSRWAIDDESPEWAAILDVLAIRTSGQFLSDEEINARLQAAQHGPRSGGGRSQGSAVAVIPIYGVISPKANLMARMSGGTSAEAISQSLRAAMADPDVSGIVLDVDSPGGVVEGMEELAAEIRAARAEKPIVAVANHTAASAAYWLAASANEVVATPSARVGSIGVFTAHDDVTEAREKLGVKRTIISAGKYKAEGALGTPLGDEGLAHLQGQVEEFYSMFVASVAKGRGVGVESVRETYGQGRSVLAKAALASGMVDRIGSLEDAIKRVARGAVKGHEAAVASTDLPVIAAAAEPDDDAPADPPAALTTGAEPAATQPAAKRRRVDLEVLEAAARGGYRLPQTVPGGQ